MNSLVGYVSSDEDEVVDREPERPAKVGTLLLYIALESMDAY